MKYTLNFHVFVLSLSLLFLASSCQQPGGNNPGSEFMPDMAHAVSYEANYYTYYSYNTWGTEDEYYEYAKPRVPVKGTVPRGYAGLSYDGHDAHLEKSMQGELLNSSISIPMNGSVPYHYEDTGTDRMKASDELMNPFPISDAEMKDVKELYDIYCGICHGTKADGDGYLAREGTKYPVQPANLLLDQFVTMTNGQFYFTIMYGKNLMGGYADKLSYPERWQVIHYIRSLQAKNLKLAYNENENTLDEWATPANMMKGHDEMPSNDTDAVEIDNSHDDAHPVSDDGHDNQHENDTPEAPEHH